MRVKRSNAAPHPAIVTEAAAWFIEFRAGDLDGESRDRFMEWLRRSPEHIQAYLEVSSAWSELPSSDPGGRLDMQAMISRARAEADIVMLPSAHPPPTRSVASSGGASPFSAHPAARISMLIAACALLIFGGIGAFALWHDQIYTTGIGEQRTVRLDDGSTVDLNARSEVNIRFTRQQRLVELSAGQALFHVAKDKDHPFIVQTGDTRVRAIGTEFDVNKKKSGSTIVTVVEGRVAVYSGSKAIRTATTQSSYLSAGEQVTVTPKAAPSISRSVDSGAVTAWVQRRLVFEETPLSDVADEFNRYNNKPLLIEDSDLQQLKISGILIWIDWKFYVVPKGLFSDLVPWVVLFDISLLNPA